MKANVSHGHPFKYLYTKHTKAIFNDPLVSVSLCNISDVLCNPA